MDPNEQDRWLEIAVEKQLSNGKLAQPIRMEREPIEVPSPVADADSVRSLPTIDSVRSLEMSQFFDEGDSAVSQTPQGVLDDARASAAISQLLGDGAPIVRWRRQAAEV